MENEDEEVRIRHIRLPVKEDTEERGFYWERKRSKEIPERNYTEGVEKIMQSSFTVGGKQLNIFKITLSGKPTPSEIDTIFGWFRAKPAVYLSSQEVLLKSTSEDFNKKVPTLITKAREVIRKFVEEVTLLLPEDKMTSELFDILQEKGHPENLKSIVFLVPGFDKREIQDLYEQISSLITQSGDLEILDLESGILLSSASVGDTGLIVEKPYILHVSEEVGLQTLEEAIPLKIPPDTIPPKDDDPVVCVVDTGADPETLGSALVECSHEDDLPDGIDSVGHGIEEFELYISDITVAEIERTPDMSLRTKMKNTVSHFSVLSSSGDIEWLSEKYIQYGAIPEKYAEDAFHIAIAVINEIDFLLSWNFKHIVRRKTRDIVKMVNTLNRFKHREIMTPAELL